MHMKRIVAVVAGLAFAAPVFAYQVTGPVLEVTDTKIVVDKAGEKHEIARTKDTKTSGAVKKGDKVTVEYTMTATKIEVKSAAKEDKPAKGKPAEKGAGAPAAR
jgi:ribosomal 50S subunit-recycling heat shock protein